MCRSGRKLIATASWCLSGYFLCFINKAAGLKRDALSIQILVYVMNEMLEKNRTYLNRGINNNSAISISGTTSCLRALMSKPTMHSLSIDSSLQPLWVLIITALVIDASLEITRKDSKQLKKTGIKHH